MDEDRGTRDAGCAEKEEEEWEEEEDGDEAQDECVLHPAACGRSELHNDSAIRSPGREALLPTTVCTYSGIEIRCFYHGPACLRRGEEMQLPTYPLMPTLLSQRIPLGPQQQLSLLPVLGSIPYHSPRLSPPPPICSHPCRRPAAFEVCNTALARFPTLPPSQFHTWHPHTHPHSTPDRPCPAPVHRAIYIDIASY